MNIDNQKKVEQIVTLIKKYPKNEYKKVKRYNFVEIAKMKIWKVSTKTTNNLESRCKTGNENGKKLHHKNDVHWFQAKQDKKTAENLVFILIKEY
jgi:hypothetical protein